MDDANHALVKQQTYGIVPNEGIRASMVTTAFTIDGHKIVKNLGVVRGIIVRSRSLVGNFAAGLQMIVGGNVTILTNLCEQTRNEAFRIMLEHAAQIGANAVIGMRYDATEIARGATEVLAYGTAVVVEADGPYR